MTVFGNIKLFWVRKSKLRHKEWQQNLIGVSDNNLEWQMKFTVNRWKGKCRWENNYNAHRNKILTDMANFIHRE